MGEYARQHDEAGPNSTQTIARAAIIEPRGGGFQVRAANGRHYAAFGCNVAVTLLCRGLPTATPAQVGPAVPADGAGFLTPFLLGISMLC